MPESAQKNGIAEMSLPSYQVRTAGCKQKKGIPPKREECPSEQLKCGGSEGGKKVIV
jgi:hypothetical protein